MSIAVSSWFLSQLAANDVSPKKVLTIGSSDYSSRLTRWPRFKRTWDMVRPTDLNLELANEDKAMNFLVDTPSMLVSECQIQFGFTHPTSGDELFTVYNGKIQRAEFSRGAVTLHMLDKMKSFTERSVGDKENPVIFTGTLPSDIAWTLCTCYGGLSSIESDSNTDIEYSSFEQWANVFSTDNVLMDAQFEGLKVSECLKRLSHMTDSAIFNEHAQIEFRRFSAADSNYTILTEDHILDMKLTVDDSDIINQQYVLGGYDVNSGSWSFETLSVGSSSVNTYGPRSNVLKDDAIWYSDSASALNMAQRITNNLSEPLKKFDITSVIIPMNRSLGETIAVVDSFFNVNSTSLRIMGSTIDLNSNKMSLQLDASRFKFQFILDDSIYGLLDQDYNFLL